MASQIYIHFTDKTLVLDSSENLLYPLLGSMLKWDELRVGIALSLTQSASDNNAGFSTQETLPIVSNLPLLNRFSIGLKNRGLELPGEVGCSFAGFSNANNSDGSSLGFFEGTLFASHANKYGFNVNLANTGSNHRVSGVPVTIPLSTPFNASGTTHILSPGETINFGGNVVTLSSSVSHGQTNVTVYAPSLVTITAAQLNGSTSSNVIRPNTCIGGSINNTFTFTQTSSISQALTFPASFVMQGSSNYSSVLLLSFKTTNRGTFSQTMKVGMQVVPYIGDTSPANVESLMTSFSPLFETSVFGYNTTMPTCLFIRWPFITTRLRIHSLCAKKF